MLNLPAARSERTGLILLWAERALSAAGIIMLAWVAWVLADTWAAQRLARETLALAPPSSPAALPQVAGRPRVLLRGAPLGELSIPSVGLSAVVLQGSDAGTLRRGPGHIENTSLPGQPGNVAIAGHRDSFFRAIRHVHVGDDIFINTREGAFRYRVSSLKVVPPTETSVLRAPEQASLTLITCYPFWAVGPAPDRFVLRATEVSAPATRSDRVLVSAATTVRDSDTITPPAARAPTADVLVQQAIERFQLMYNARVAAGRETGRLVLGACQIDVGKDAAMAACVDASGGATGPRRWNFSLSRTGGGWAISSVETP